MCDCRGYVTLVLQGAPAPGQPDQRRPPEMEPGQPVAAPRGGARAKARPAPVQPDRWNQQDEDLHRRREEERSAAVPRPPERRRKKSAAPAPPPTSTPLSSAAQLPGLPDISSIRPPSALSITSTRSTKKRRAPPPPAPSPASASVLVQQSATPPAPIAAPAPVPSEPTVAAVNSNQSDTNKELYATVHKDKAKCNDENPKRDQAEYLDSDEIIIIDNDPQDHSDYETVEFKVPEEENLKIKQIEAIVESALPEVKKKKKKKDKEEREERKKKKKKKKSPKDEKDFTQVVTVLVEDNIVKIDDENDYPQNKENLEKEEKIFSHAEAEEKIEKFDKQTDGQTEKQNQKKEVEQKPIESSVTPTAAEARENRDEIENKKSKVTTELPSFRGAKAAEVHRIDTDAEIKPETIKMKGLEDEIESDSLPGSDDELVDQFAMTLTKSEQIKRAKSDKKATTREKNARSVDKSFRETPTGDDNSDSDVSDEINLAESENESKYLSMSDQEDGDNKAVAIQKRISGKEIEEQKKREIKESMAAAAVRSSDAADCAESGASSETVRQGLRLQSGGRRPPRQVELEIEEEEELPSLASSRASSITNLESEAGFTSIDIIDCKLHKLLCNVQP